MGGDSASGDTSCDDVINQPQPDSASTAVINHEPKPVACSSRSVHESDPTSALSDDNDALFKPPTSCSEDVSDSDGPWKKSFNNAFKSIKQHTCTFKGCERTFTRPWRLAAHIRMHNGERPFRCTVEGCNREYTNNAHLRRHSLRNHRKTEVKTRIKCPHKGCYMELSDKTSLNRHVERKHSTPQFSCPVCGLKFAKRLRLTEHVHQHDPSPLKPLYRCDVCGVGFFEKARYNKHRVAHRTYTCSYPQCLFTCTMWSRLRRHTVVEHPAEKFTCAECDRTFAVKTNLKMHMETHKGLDERQVYRCRHEGCNSGYYQRRNLTAHIRRKHTDQLFLCIHPQCNQSLSTMQKLKEHVATQHGVAKATKKKKKSKAKRYSNSGKPTHSMATSLLSVVLPAKKEKKLVKFKCSVPSSSSPDVAGPSGLVTSGSNVVAGTGSRECLMPELKSLHKLLETSDSASTTDGP